MLVHEALESIEFFEGTNILLKISVIFIQKISFQLPRGWLER